MVSMDLIFPGGQELLVIADRYSRWLTMDITDNSGANGLIIILNNYFCAHCVPIELSMDGGPQFTAAAMQTFLAKYSITHKVSSLGNPHSNN